MMEKFADSVNWKGFLTSKVTKAVQDEPSHRTFIPLNHSEESWKKETVEIQLESTNFHSMARISSKYFQQTLEFSFESTFELCADLSV